MKIQYRRESVHQEIKQAITLRFNMDQSNLGLYILSKMDQGEPSTTMDWGYW